MNREPSPLPLSTDQIHSALTSGVLSVGITGADIEGFVQDGWVVVLTKRAELERVAPAALKTYIRQIGKRNAIDRLRRQHAKRRGGEAQRVELPPSRELRSRGADPERTTISREELQRALAKACGRGKRAAQVLGLLFRGLSPQQVAETLGISVSGVYSALSIARGRLASRRGI